MSAKRPLRLTLAAGLLFSAALPAQNLISNGSFENPALSAPETNYQLPRNSTWLTDWLTPTSADGASTNTTVRHQNLTTVFSATDGTQFLTLGASSYVAQFANLIEGQDYRLSFDIVRPAAGTGSLGLTITDGADDTFSGTFNIIGGTSYTWESKTFDFTAGETDEYRFVFSRATGTIGLDNIVLTAVPEPSACAAFAASAVLLGAISRRRRRA